MVAGCSPRLQSRQRELSTHWHSVRIANHLATARVQFAGSQYVREPYLRAPTDFGLCQSMASLVHRRDDAESEIFMEEPRDEWICLTDCEPLEEVATQLPRVIEKYLKAKRLNLAPGYVRPIEFEIQTA